MLHQAVIGSNCCCA